MNNKQIQEFIKTGELTRKSVGDGLYIRVQTAGKSSWLVRCTIKGKPKFIVLEGGHYPQLSLADAKAEAIKIKQQVKAGIDPLIERARLKEKTISTVDDLFTDWYPSLEKRLKHPEITKRIYIKEIKPSIGRFQVVDVTPLHIRGVIHKVAQSNRPATANDTLSRCKQLFNHACKLGLINGNPALAFNYSDAGGEEKSRDRVLTIKELTNVFKILRDNADIFTRDNYLTVALLVTLGVRKGELIASQWREFDFDKKVWKLPKDRIKTGVAIDIPLPDLLIPWFEELYVRAGGSDYLFPSRRASKHRGYISDDTLNHALAKLFGKKVDSKKQPYENLLGKVGVEHFTVHDLRRTFRSLLAEIGVHGYIAERCLNHKLRGVEGIYNKHDYFDERQQALTKLACVISPLVNNMIDVTPFQKRA